MWSDLEGRLKLFAARIVSVGPASSPSTSIEIDGVFTGPQADFSQLAI
jgi:hypothetical protein